MHQGPEGPTVDIDDLDPSPPEGQTPSDPGPRRGAGGPGLARFGEAGTLLRRLAHALSAGELAGLTWPQDQGLAIAFPEVPRALGSAPSEALATLRQQGLLVDGPGGRVVWDTTSEAGGSRKALVLTRLAADAVLGGGGGR
jgi:hypothetical protein